MVVKPWTVLIALRRPEIGEPMVLYGPSAHPAYFPVENRFHRTPWYTRKPKKS